MSRDGYFSESLNISISTFCTFCACADGFQGILKAFHTFYLLLWNYLLIWKMLYWNHSQNSLFCDWSMFSSADISLAAGKSHKYWLVTGGFSVILKSHRQLPVCIFSVNITALESLKRVTVRISILVSNFNFKGAS